MQPKAQQSKAMFVSSEDDSQRPRSRSVQCSPCLSPPLSTSGLEYDPERRSSASDTHHDRPLHRCEYSLYYMIYWAGSQENPQESYCSKKYIKAPYLSIYNSHICSKSPSPFNSFVWHKCHKNYVSLSLFFVFWFWGERLHRHVHQLYSSVCLNSD